MHIVTSQLTVGHCPTNGLKVSQASATEAIVVKTKSTTGTRNVKRQRREGALET